MKGYNSANGDKRGILERFLPTTYRTTVDGSNTHNAFLGAIKNSIETTRDDVENISLQVYFTKATGRFLDLYGKYIGLSRSTGESDESYRDRLVSYIKTKRGTIDAIISGIRNELNDPDVPVSIYETWRNIFILNQSKLNGLDYIMGEKYRYAVIEVIIGKYVEPDILKDIVSRYKAYGVLVIYRYSLGITENYYDSVVDFSDNYYNSDKEYSTIPTTEPYFKNYTVTLGDSPLTTDDINSFITNKSNINGTDVLSGNPENAYIYDYNNSPSHHIIGYVPNSAQSIDDPYDYIYQNTKVDLSTVGGRNYVINSSGLSASSSAQPTLIGATSSTSRSTLSYSADGITMANAYGNTDSEWYYQIAQSWLDITKTPLSDGNYMISVDVMGTASQAILRYGQTSSQSSNLFQAFAINNTTWTRISMPIVFAPNTTTFYIRINGGANGAISGTGIFTGTETIKFRNVKIESGNKATDWTPAPEDTPKIYTYPFTTEPYLVTSKKDSNYFEFDVPDGKSLVLGVDTLSFLRNNGYTDKAKSYSPTSISAINVYTKGTEVGLPPTAISPVASNGDAITGSFSGKSTVTEPTVSSGKYTFTFTKSSSLKSVNVIDYYKFGINNRIITLKSNNLELPLSVSNSQVTGTVYSPDYLAPMKPVVVSYTNKFTLDIISNSNNIYIYNFTKSMWELYKDSIFTISDYIEDSTKISGSYMLIKISGSNIRLNYFALNINSVNIQ